MTFQKYFTWETVEENHGTGANPVDMLYNPRLEYICSRYRSKNYFFFAFSYHIWSKIICESQLCQKHSKILLIRCAMLKWNVDCWAYNFVDKIFFRSLTLSESAGASKHKNKFKEVHLAAVNAGLYLNYRLHINCWIINMKKMHNWHQTLLMRKFNN